MFFYLGGYMFTDTHCHLFKSDFENIDIIINDAIKNGVNRFIVNGFDMESNLEVLDLIKKYDCVYGAIGFHPTELDDFKDEYYSWLEKNIDNPKIVAVGEIGLDYHYNGTDRDKQIVVFKKQIEIANNHNKPIICHSRDAIQDTYNIIKETNVRGVLHCYSGSKEMAKEFIKLGIYLGIGGISTFKNANNIIDVINNIDLNNILLETDSPYLTPEPYRKYKNEPKYLSVIADKICLLKGVSLEELSSITNANIMSLFDF